LQIKKPDRFLREAVIKQDNVQEWLRKQASVSWKSKFGHYKWKAPEIWMCTGIQLVTRGTVQTGASNSSSIHASAGADIGLVAGLTPGVAAVKVEGNHGHGEEAMNGYAYDDERIWAAQFMEISIEYGEGEADKELSATLEDHKVVPKTIATFRLKEVADLKVRGIRASPARRSDGNITPPMDKMPKPIGRITIKDIEGEESESEEEGDGGILIDETRYVDALKNTDWEMYRNATHYLDDKEREEQAVAGASA
jgi:hypothetical protein